LRVVGWIAHEQAILRDNPAIDFAVPEFASKFSFLWGCFAPLNNRGVWLKQTDDLFGCGHRLVPEDPSCRLLNHLAHQGHILRQEFRERQRALTSASPQTGLDRLDLGQNDFDEVDELAIQVFAQFFETVA
jgi:hypothetical protein